MRIDKKYDYMFLSNISDYIDTFYENNYLSNYKKLIDKFMINVKYIYFAYVYDINKKDKRSVIDDINEVKSVFKNFEIKKFKTSLINKGNNTEDAVFIKEEK